MVKAERYTKKVLSEIEVSRLRAICVETENGVSLESNKDLTIPKSARCFMTSSIACAMRQKDQRNESGSGRPNQAMHPTRILAGRGGRLLHAAPCLASIVDDMLINRSASSDRYQ